MAWNIYPKVLKEHTCYYAQRSFREQLPAKDGKRPKSKVRTETVYLGTAESIVNRFKGSRTPIEVRHRAGGIRKRLNRKCGNSSYRLEADGTGNGQASGGSWWYGGELIGWHATPRYSLVLPGVI